MSEKARLYIKCTPRKIGHDTGREPLGAFIASHRFTGNFQSCNFESVIHDSKTESEFGILTGNGDEISNLLEMITNMFSAKRLTEDEMIGGCWIVYNDIPDQIGLMGNEKLSFDQFIANAMNISFNPSRILPAVKLYKSNIFKEVSKRMFYDDNDSIADLSKAVMAITVYYPSLTSEEKTIVDNTVNDIKNIYSKEVAINGLIELRNQLAANLIPYYTAKMALVSAQTPEEAVLVQYNG